MLALGPNLVAKLLEIFRMKQIVVIKNWVTEAASPSVGEGLLCSNQIADKENLALI